LTVSPPYTANFSDYYDVKVVEMRLQLPIDDWKAAMTIEHPELGWLAISASTDEDGAPPRAAAQKNQYWTLINAHTASGTSTPLFFELA
jgi:hypothetical protein